MGVPYRNPLLHSVDSQRQEIADRFGKVPDYVVTGNTPGINGFLDTWEVPEYIGGTPSETRQKFWSKNPIILQAVQEAAQRYNINPALLKNRLNREGFVDSAIERNNARHRDNQRMPYIGLQEAILHDPQFAESGFGYFGTDDVGTLIQEGKVKLQGENWGTGDNDNEKGRKVLSAEGHTNYDNIGINAAALKYFQDTVKQDYPNISDEDLDRYTQAYYNRGIAGGKKWAENGAEGYNIKSEGGPIKSWQDLSLKEKNDIIKVAVKNGINKLDDIKSEYNSFAEGGHLYGGETEPTQKLMRYTPSNAIKSRISKWEGKAMTGAKDPLSGKFLTNNSFEYEAKAFTDALPEAIRNQVLSNPRLADYLFSYSYNVGAGNFKKRVVPALNDYYSGRGSASNIAASMWASGDAKLRGLKNRREEEKFNVREALRDRGPIEKTSSLTTAYPYIEGYRRPMPWLEGYLAENAANTFSSEFDWGRTMNQYDWQNWPLQEQFEPDQPLVDAAYSEAALKQAEEDQNRRNLNMVINLLSGGKQTATMNALQMLNNGSYADGGILNKNAHLYGLGDWLRGVFKSAKAVAETKPLPFMEEESTPLPKESQETYFTDTPDTNLPDYLLRNSPYQNENNRLPEVSTRTFEWLDGHYAPITEKLMHEVVISAPKNKSKYQELSQASLFDTDYMQNQYNQEILNSMKTKSPEELKNIQRELADKGAYDINTDNMTEHQIKALQRKIGTKDDGIWGKDSIKKYREYNIDGKYGKRTEQALLTSWNNQRWDRDVPTANTEWCAEWVSKKVDDAAGGDLGVWGDAWTMPKHVVDAGGEMVYNLYDSPAFKGITNIKDLKKITEKELGANSFDISNLKVGDIVGIYMPSSNMHEVALKEGSTFNTHVGVVTGYDSKGVPIIEHNIHKSHRKDPANRLTGSAYGRPQIATVTRPAYHDSHAPFNTDLAESDYVNDKDSPLFQTFAKSVSGSKELLSKVFPDVDMDAVEQITLSVQGRETGFMKNRRSDQTGLSKAKVWASDIYRDKIKKKDPETVSSNLSKMKLSSFTKNERYMLGINSPEDLEKPELAGRAASYLMAKNYDYFKRLQRMYPDLGITDKDIEYLTELSYNQGMTKLRNIGFNEDGIAPEELESIRAMSAPDAKVKDVTATNYRHLGKVGKFVYDHLEEGHTPYIAAAEKYRQKLKDKALENKG